LVEVSLALAIMSSVIVSSAALASTAVRYGNEARHRTEAASIAEQEAEILRNARDASITGGSDGWNSFVDSTLGIASVTPVPICGGSPPPTPFYTTVAPSTLFSGGNTWTKASSNPNSYPSGSNYNIVKTSQWSYDTWVEACTLDGSASLTPSSIRFTIQLRWAGPGSGVTEQAALDTELVDVGGINGLSLIPTSGSGSPPAPPTQPVTPSITLFAIKGSSSGSSSMYDSGQESVRLYWTSSNATGCRITGPNELNQAVPSSAWPSPWAGASLADNTNAGAITYYLICSNAGVDSPQVVASGIVQTCEPASVLPTYPLIYGYRYSDPDPVTGVRTSSACEALP
jgi:hypothetical protein